MVSKLKMKYPGLLIPKFGFGFGIWNLGFGIWNLKFGICIWNLEFTCRIV